jgi:PST family polysaccharide transporter
VSTDRHAADGAVAAGEATDAEIDAHAVTDGQAPPTGGELTAPAGAEADVDTDGQAPPMGAEPTADAADLRSGGVHDLRGFGREGRMDARAAAVSGARWLPFAQLINQAVRIVLSIVLAWYLTTEEFGLVAVAMVVMVLIDSLADLGTGQAIIQRRRLDANLADAIFTLNTCIGVGLGLAIIVFAEPLTYLAGGPDAGDAVGLMQVLGINVIIKSMGVVQFALLRRRLMFRKAALSLVASACLYLVVSLSLAVAGAGAWSIVIGTTAGSLASVALTWVWSGWRPRLRFDWPAIRSVSGFSLNLTGTSLFNYATQNLDRVLIAWNLGTAPLGLYTLGTRILRAPIITVTHTVNQVQVPMMARVQDDLAAQRRMFLQASAVAALVVFPAMLGLTVLAEPIIDFGLPARWHDATDLIMVMAPLGMLRTLWGLVSPIYVANGRTGLQLLWSIFFGGMLLISYVLTSQISVLAVVVGIAVVHLVAMPIVFHVPFGLIDLRFGTYVRHLVPVTVASAVMAASVVAGRLGLESLGWSPAAVVAGCVPLGVAVYGVFLVVLRPPGLDELLAILGRRTTAPLTRRAMA